MIYSSLLLFYYVVLTVVTFVLLLSATGTSSGIRRRYAKFVLSVFEWAAEQDTECQLLNEVEPESEEEVNVINADLQQKEIASSNGESDDVELIDRHWTSSIDHKLRRDHSRSASRGVAEPENIGCDATHNVKNCSSNAGSTITDPEMQTIKVIVNDSLEFVSAGVESIIEDEVTSRFNAAQLPSWNLLSRSRAAYGAISWKLGAIWFVGCVIRYFILLPVRFLIFVSSLLLIIVTTTIIGYVPHERTRKTLNHYAMLMCMRMSCRAFSSIVTFHNQENRPTHGICVANHTTPVDVMILSTDNVYAMIGQRQGGLLGLLQASMSRSAHHIWFERSESGDRKKVGKVLREHVEDENKLPILIFPEGTCINNTSVMLFKKGSFEISTTIYPIAIKYDNRLGDAFWNSHEQSYFAYLLSMMTAWALVCDVWYLPPVTRRDEETPIEFARRVQRMIAQKGGLVDLEWDGNLKRAQVPERLKKEQKELFYQYLMRSTALCSCGKRAKFLEND